MTEPHERAAYRKLLRDVLQIDPDDAAMVSDLWTPFAIFEPAGRCVANVDAGRLPLILDGVTTAAAALRSVAVAYDWRGQGLFRNLMTEALAWCDAQTATPALLYTEEPALYGRFGFRPMPQYAFVGSAPRIEYRPPAHPLDLDRASDRAAVAAMVARRTPVSSQCALCGDAAMFMTNVAKDDDLTIVHAGELDALIVFEADAGEIVIADVVASAMPPLADVLGVLDQTAERVKLLFPTDKLAWSGAPIPEDTGLMIRGPLPAAMSRPFMLPPTAEF